MNEVFNRGGKPAPKKLSRPGLWTPAGEEKISVEERSVKILNRVG